MFIILETSFTFSFAVRDLVIGEVIIYLFLPFLLVMSVVPTMWVAEVMTVRLLKRAQQKIASGNTKIIGIGGSYGKTTTKHLLAHLLSQKYSVFLTPKSHNTKYSVALSIWQKYKSEEIAILEYGAYKIGEIAYLTKWFPPVMAVETGFTLQHVGLFGSAENSMKAESELVAALPLGSKVFCNSADEGAAKICQIGSEINRAEIVPYSGQNVPEFDNISIDRDGNLSFSWELRLIKTHLIGEHYLHNIHAAIAVSQELGLTTEQIVSGLQSFEPNESFIHSHALPGGALCIDDGVTCNPQGFKVAINLIKLLPQTNKILVTPGIVDLGSESDNVHQELALQASAVFQKVAYVGIDGHNEFQKEFGERFITDQNQIMEMLKTAKTDTVVLLEGRMPGWLADLVRENKQENEL